MEAPCKLVEAIHEPLQPRRSARLDISASSCSHAPAQLPPLPSRGPVSVVVGAGPAGILTAVYLARRGHEVHVYDRRPSPLHVDSSDETRAIAVMLNARGQLALEQAGFDIPALASHGSGLQRVCKMAVGGSSNSATVQLPLPRLMGPRHVICAGMLAQAQAMHPTAITWHWGASFEGADLAAKTATFTTFRDGSGSSTGSGSSCAGSCSTCPAQQQGQCQGSTHTHTHTRSDDLLVGADGGWSRVRRTAEKQVPALQSSIQASAFSYKVFRGMPASPALPLQPNGASAVPTAAAGTACDDMPQLRVLLSSGGGLAAPAVIFMGCDPADGTARGMLSMQVKQWEGQGLCGKADAEAHAAFLARHFPGLPTEWILPMARQLAENPLAPGGMRVHASQLHGPGLLLVGDAAHGVTPRTGNGMNSALQDAWLVDQLLGEGNGDLATLPERFTAARLDDARALLWLDVTADARGGTSRWRMAHPAALANLAATLARTALSRITGDWVRPPALTVVHATCTPYSQIKAQVQRDNAAVAVVALGALAALAAACLRHN